MSSIVYSILKLLTVNYFLFLGAKQQSGDEYLFAFFLGELRNVE
jgi:hypothetical protein